MRSARGIVRHCCFAVCFGTLLLAATVKADVTTERSSSVLIFPKVVYDPDGLLTGVPGVDTLIQITNTSNTIRYLHRFHPRLAQQLQHRVARDPGQNRRRRRRLHGGYALLRL